MLLIPLCLARRALFNRCSFLEHGAFAVPAASAAALQTDPQCHQRARPSPKGRDGERERTGVIHERGRVAGF